MGGADFAGKPRELFWELRETEEQKRARAARTRLLYALVDPRGWDARRLGAVDVAAAWRLTCGR